MMPACLCLRMMTRILDYQPSCVDKSPKQDSFKVDKKNSMPTLPLIKRTKCFNFSVGQCTSRNLELELT